LASLKKNPYGTYILVLSFIGLILLAWLSCGRRGLTDLYKMQKERDRCMAVIDDLKEKNRLLTAEIRRLREDPKYFESVARKELGLIKENEMVYRLGIAKRGNENSDRCEDLTK
jgi:cell division protein FtsB